ncbi:MAG: MBL fold metallo-hydrolase, partial [Epsilonproteobacteria bacterium]|nr:MBL fold metallo-hydrolase [Campylobacterota bacterium]NPA57652.1 MBL fold metallo-hydrolase [Campylobacterota bacterium]
PKRRVRYGREIRLSPTITVTYRDAGHIIGSAFLQIDYREGRRKKRVIFSGDLGNHQVPLTPPPAPPSKADYLFVESTYGDRLHRSYRESLQEFRRVVTETLTRGGSVVIPSFAIERTQQLLCILGQMSREGKLPEDSLVFLDSPMGVRATKVYRKYREYLSPPCREREDPFIFPQLRFSTTTAASKRINSIPEKVVIIAGSGMCTGGRILHHLKHRIWNPKNSLIFVGYQAQGTLGRQIVDGASSIEIYGERVVVRAQVSTINGFSAHADQRELIQWISEAEGVQKLFIVHGERDKEEIFRKAVMGELGLKAHIVREGEIIRL